MILDTSAIVAVFLREPDFEDVLEKLDGTDQPLGIGTPTLVETGIVLAARLKADPRPALAKFLADFEVAAIPFGDPHWREALEAFARFGKGRHKAALNFGDCMTYATARLSGQALLFAGDDFRKTDLSVA